MKVGVTGGIGSGKSVVCHMFSLLGIPVYNADAAARNLLNTDRQLQQEVVRLLGETALLPDKTINRSFIASRVFGNPDLLSRLNALVHPAVTRDYTRWEQRSTAPYSIREAAILFEADTYKDLDFVVLVTAPADLRRNRVRARDGRSDEEIDAIMQRQWSDEKKRTLANATLENDDSHLLIPQILELHRQFVAHRV